MRPGQLEEMASMAMWVATAAMALEDRKAGREAPSVPTSVAPEVALSEVTAII